MHKYPSRFSPFHASVAVIPFHIHSCSLQRFHSLLSTAVMILTRVLLASLALGPALALPAAPAEGEIFSFSQWVEGIIANPDGNNLTPDEAVAAWTASLNTTRDGELKHWSTRPKTIHWL
jgi:hypothetical protein